MNTSVSVIIPTKNRCGLLLRALDSLEHQVDAPELEVIVVDDGSSDGTPEVVRSRRYGFPLTLVSQAAGGPAKARNLGLRHARGDVIAFFGDDTILDSNCLSVHEAARRSVGRDIAVLGHVVWHPELRTSRFMRHIGEYGPQFAYKLIQDPDDLPFEFFYTSNVSLPRHCIESVGGFDEGFVYAAYEDYELSYRMSATGLRMLYRGAAICYHHHLLTPRRLLERQYICGRAAAVLCRKHPELMYALGAQAALRTSPAILKSLHRMSRILPYVAFAVPSPWYGELLKFPYLAGLRDESRAMAVKTGDSADSATDKTKSRMPDH